MKNKFIYSYNCLELANKIIRNSNSSNVKEILRKSFKGRTVIANYDTFNTYIIEDIIMDRTPASVVMRLNKNKGNDSNTENPIYNLVAYYKIKYNKFIEHNDQFLFLVRLPNYKKKIIDETRENSSNFTDQKNEILLVPELCLLPGILEEDPKKDSTKDILLKNNKAKADNDITSIKEFVKYSKNDTTQHKRKDRKPPIENINHWGININNLTEIEGKAINGPKLEFSKDSVETKDKRNFQIREVINIIENHEYNFSNNNVVFFTTKHLKYEIDKIAEKIKSSSTRLGIHVGNLTNEYNRILLDNNPKIEDWLNAIIDEASKFNSKLERDKPFFIFILDSKSSAKETYSRIKNECDNYLIRSQCIKSLDKMNNLSVVGNLLKQMYCKNGGILYNVHLGRILHEKPSYIVGVEENTFGMAMSMSTNKNHNKFLHLSKRFDKNNSSSKLENSKKAFEYLVNTILEKGCNKISLKTNEKLNQTYLIIYRALNNENNFFKISEEESLICKKIKEKYNFENLILTYVIKNNDLRFISIDKESMELNKHNHAQYVQSGIVVDSKIVSSNSHNNESLYEFYLLSSSLSGGPVRYKTVLNEGNKDNIFTLEEFENITYSLCYYYYGFAGAIKVPSCIKYAEKNLEFKTLLNEFSEEIKNGLNNDSIEFNKKPHFL